MEIAISTGVAAAPPIPQGRMRMLFIVLMIVLSVQNRNREACHSLTYIVPHLLDSGDRLTRGFGMDMGNYLNKSGSDRGV